MGCPTNFQKPTLRGGEDVGVINAGLVEEYDPEELLEDFPLKPHELLRDVSYRVHKQLVLLAKRQPKIPVWVLDDEGGVEVTCLGELADKENKERINHRTLLLPSAAGGLQDGLLNGASSAASDVSDAEEFQDEQGNRLRLHLWDNERVPKEMRLIRTIDTKPMDDFQESETTTRRFCERGQDNRREIRDS